MTDSFLPPQTRADSPAREREREMISTESILREIESGTAAELSMTVRYINNPPGPTFIEPLDKLIQDCRPHPGSSTLQRGDLVEVVGPSGSGKTSLLIFILMTYLLPPTLPDLLSTPTGGRGLQATIITPRHHRSIIPLLRRSMKFHLSAIATTTSSSSSNAMLTSNATYLAMLQVQEEMIERVISQSMTNLRIYRPKNRWKDIALCLRALLDKAQPSHVSFNPPLKKTEEDVGGVDLLLIDGIGDPHYPHRWAEEQRLAARTTGAGGRLGSAGRVVAADEVGLREVMEGIGRVRKELGATVMISRQGLRTNRETQPFFLPHLPAPYPAPFAPPSSSTSNANLNTVVQRADPAFWPVNIQLTLTGRMRGLQHPGETTLTDVLRIKRAESAAYGSDEGRTRIDSQRYEGVVRMEGGQGVVASRNGAKFSFDLAAEGLRVWSEGD